MTLHPLTRSEVEDFLYMEAELLDQWKLSEWVDLFTQDALYQVPASGMAADASPDTSLFYIADDRFRLNERAVRLTKKAAYAESPHSKTRHVVSNVRIASQDENNVEARANFTVHRFKDGTSVSFVGQYAYVLARSEAGLKIRFKRCTLDHDGLRPHGRISILL